jgi:alkanesulfonate monooxygenase SsuD/methylene tetrahydromethanopterin reductase-like flavin-dependent oxidoreductase (luciferase family)
VRTPRLAATHGDEYNAAFQPVADASRLFDATRKACDAIGRDPASLKRSVALPVCCGQDEAEVALRAGAIRRDVAELRDSGFTGTPAEVVEKIGAYAAIGADRVYLQVLDMDDLEHIALLAAEVLPHV